MKARELGVRPNNCTPCLHISVNKLLCIMRKPLPDCSLHLSELAGRPTFIKLQEDG
jgi:hypothetical protein